jgi:uncharacterized protein YbcI
MNYAVAEPATRSSCLKSQGEIEAAVCDGISRFQQEFIGRGPRDIHSHLVGDLIVVRLQGVLTPAERQLIAPRGEPAGAASAEAGRAAVKAPGNGNGDGHSNGNGNGQAGDNGNGRALLKQIRAHMVSAGRPRLAEIVEMAVGVKLVSVHHDISTITGEELLVFSLAESPTCRPKKKP